MITSNQSEHDLLNDLAERYEREGYEVIKEPNPSLLPFDLGSYRPDLLARKDSQNLIIEVRTQSERISFDRLRSVVDEVKRHEGWRFLLVTGQDIEDPVLPGESSDSFSWDEVSGALKDAEAPSTQRAQVLAFLGLWVVFERMMRFQSRRISLPVERLASPRTMIDQLYSLGELSAQQLDTATRLVPVRNRVFHGLDTFDLSADLNRLAALVRELREEWSLPTDSSQ